MKKTELQKIIYEEVKKALREEIRDILVEAVQIASVPEKPQTVSREVEPSNYSPKGNSGVVDILKETARSMTRQDYRDFAGIGERESTVLSNIGIDSELPSFAANAAAIFEASEQIKK